MLATGFRMREVVRRSGVSAQSIRFYIREGLLPRPHKLARNSALYDDAFVDRVRLIKELQTERYLPLKVIRDLLRRGAISPEKLPAARPVADLLVASAKGSPLDPIYTRHQLLGFGITVEDLRTLEKASILAPVMDKRSKRYGEADLRVAQAIGALKRLGLRRLGFDVKDVVQLGEMVRLLVRHEIRVFTDKVLDKLGTREIVELVERVLPLSAQLIDALRASAQIRELTLVRDG